MAASSTGSTVELSTFKSWGKENVIGYDVKTINDKQHVTRVWCKLCRKHSKDIQSHPTCKGPARRAMLAYVDGTSYVAKCNVMRHLSGKAHLIAIWAEQGTTSEQRLSEDAIGAHQTKITTSIDNAAREAYRKMFTTAYELAVTPTMPLQHFEVLIKCQRKNGVRLIKGKSDSHACKEYIHYIADAVSEKVAVILGSSDFMSVLSDGSQARKTKKEKELILVRTERNGIPVYFVSSLLEMADYGGANANSIKKAIDQVFCEKMHLDEESYLKSMVAATADGASVNFGIYQGVLTQLKSTRPWLLTIHCVNHRVELAVKDAMKVKPFEDVDQFYQANATLLKRSSDLTAALSRTAAAMNITCYNLPKITGTRFVSHRRRGLQRLLHMWPVFITAYENVIAENKKKAETIAKLRGLLIKFRTVKVLYNVCSYLDLLDKISPISLVFEGNDLLPCEIQPSLLLTLEGLDELTNAKEVNDVPIDSNLLYFSFEANDGDATASMSREYQQSGNEKRKERNKEFITVTVGGMQMNGAEFLISDTIGAVAIKLRENLIDRFSDFSSKVYQDMKWLDPQNWQYDNKEYGNQQIVDLSNHFQVPLESKGFLLKQALIEWKSLKRIVPKYFSPETSAFSIWRSLLCKRKDEFPNMCLLAKLLLTISGSNSSVERGFSILTMMLSDHRLSTSQEVLEERMIISANDKNWSDTERQEIIDVAIDAYMKKRRLKQTELLEPPEKIQKVTCDKRNDSDNTSDSENEFDGISSVVSSESETDDI